MTAGPKAPKRVLFVGGLFDDPLRMEVDALSVGGPQAAADALQWGFVDGIASLPNKDLSVISAPFIGSYPKRYKRAFVRSRAFEYAGSDAHRIIGFLNLPLIKHIWRAIALAQAVRKWVDSEKSDAIVIGYSLSFDIMVALDRAQRSRAHVTTAVVIPDLPEYMNTSERPGWFYTVLKSVEARIVRHLVSRASAMVILTEQMRGRLPAIPSIVIEGIARSVAKNPTGAVEQLAERSGRTVMYAGTLNRKYGVLDLCKAFMALEDDTLRLVLCGSGDAAERVRAFAQEDHRIDYRGQVSRLEVTQMESDADILVNPRTNDQNFAAFSFPSKLLEYMSVGRPVLCHKLEGIPDEYDDYLVYVEQATIESLAGGLVRLLAKSDSELTELGDRNRAFVESRKSPHRRMQELMAFISSISFANLQPIHETESSASQNEL